MNEGRIANLTADLQKADFEGVVESLVKDTLALIDTADRLLFTIPSGHEEAVRLARSTLEGFFNDCDRAIYERSEYVLRLWIRDTTRWLDKELASLEEMGADFNEVRLARERSSQIHQEVTISLDSDGLYRRAQRALTQAELAAGRAQDAAGIAGGSSLAKHFATLAGKELDAANWFRGLAIGGIIVALVTALVLGRPDANDWAGLAFRLTMLAGVGTLSAYLARQAGQHRRVYNWARSMEVQLKSFPAFIDPIPEADRSEIYRAFARRVLAAPPDGSSSSQDDTLPVSQLVDILTAVAKRS